jgi:hypothetical protein
MSLLLPLPPVPVSSVKCEEAVNSGGAISIGVAPSLFGDCLIVRVGF